MKIIQNLVYIFCLAVILSSCGGNATAIPADLAGYTTTDLTDNSALVQKIDAGGKLVESGYIVNGSKCGQWATYDVEGKLLTLTSYIEGMKNGEEIVFSSRGQIDSRNSYKNDMLHGISGTYKNGRPTQEVTYKDGQFDGVTKKYFKNGKLQQEINFKDGKQHGALRYYDEEGNVTLEYEYKNGEKVSGGIVE